MLTENKLHFLAHFRNEFIELVLTSEFFLSTHALKAPWFQFANGNMFQKLISEKGNCSLFNYAVIINLEVLPTSSSNTALGLEFLYVPYVIKSPARIKSYIDPTDMLETILGEAFMKRQFNALKLSTIHTIIFIYLLNYLCNV